MNSTPDSNRRLLMVFPFAVNGAAESYGLTLAQGISRGGWNVTIALHPAFPSVDPPTGIRIDRFPSSFPGKLRWIRRSRADLVHLIQMDLPMVAASAIAAHTAPLVVTTHTPAVAQAMSARGRLLRWATSPSVDRWIVLSARNRELLSQRQRTDPRKITVIHPGLPLELFKTSPRPQAADELGADPDALLIGTVGRLSPQKRHDVLLLAFAAVANQIDPAQLVIIGDGELRSETMALADRVAPGKVIFAGQRDDVVDLLPVIDIFVMSSDFEGLPFALLEAMGTARPIVTTDVQGSGEAVRNGQEGLVVPRRDPDAMCAAILSLAGDPGLAKRLGDAARARFRECFDAEHMVRETKALYDRLLETQETS